MQSGQNNEGKLYKLRGDFRDSFRNKKNEETDLEISKRHIDEMQSALSLGHGYEDGHLPKEEWPDGGDAAKWGVKLSQAEGVTVLLVLESHLDMSTFVASIQGVEEFLSADPDLKQKTSICHEFSYSDPESDPAKISFLVYLLTHRQHIYSAMKNDDVEPKTIRGVFSMKHPENRAIYDRFMNMVGVSGYRDNAKMINPEVSPDVDLMSYEDRNAREEFAKVSNDKDIPIEKRREEICRLTNDRNSASAFNLADYVVDKGKKLIVVVAGSAHCGHSKKTNFKQDIIDKMEGAGLPCNVVTIRTSRKEPIKSSLDFEFDSEVETVDKVLRNTLIKRGTRPTDDEALIIGDKYSGKDGKELYDQSMRVVARQEAKKDPAKRRRGASNDYTIAAAKHEAQVVLDAKKDIYEKQKEAYVNLCASNSLDRGSLKKLKDGGKGSSTESDDLDKNMIRSTKLLNEFHGYISKNHSDELDAVYQSCKNNAKIKNNDEYIASRTELFKMDERRASEKDMLDLIGKLEAYHDSVNKANRKSKSSGMSL